MPRRFARQLFVVIVCGLAAGVFVLVWYSSALQLSTRENGSAEMDYKPLQQEKFSRITTSTSRAVLNTDRVQVRPLTILLATLWYGRPWFPSSSRLLNCPGAQDGISSSLLCSVTNDMSLFNTSDAVVFHARDDILSAIKNFSSSPRPVTQRWVMYIRESPLHVPPLALQNLDRYGPVNLTATCMKDSDLHSCYYEVVPGVYHGGFDPTRNYLAGKNATAAILISNCRPPRRMEWIAKLQQHIDVHVYGRCGSECSRLDKQECMSKLRKYKFYLSFENSYCRDYITEKINSNAFENDVIPVVIADVSFTDTSVIPPRSAINALDFPSVKELTDFMKRVGSNATLYNEYFKWHSHYKAVKSRGLEKVVLCPLCRHIATNNSMKTYKSVRDWYSKKRRCRDYPVPV